MSFCHNIERQSLTGLNLCFHFKFFVWNVGKTRWCILVIITNLSSFGRAEARTIEHFSICYLLTYFFTKLKTKRNRRKSFSNCESIAWLAAVLTTRLPHIVSNIYQDVLRNPQMPINTYSDTSLEAACVKIAMRII